VRGANRGIVAGQSFELHHAFHGLSFWLDADCQRSVVENDDRCRRDHRLCLPSSKSTSSTPGSVARGLSGSMCWRLRSSASNSTIPYLADGHSEYFGQGGHRVVSPAVHEVLPVAETGQRETFLQHLRRHELRETTYLEMSRGLAQSGIERSGLWTPIG
jgi:Protein of unknown function (DUF1398)